jgi:hypothetical protein
MAALERLFMLGVDMEKGVLPLPLTVLYEFR